MSFQENVFKPVIPCSTQAQERYFATEEERTAFMRNCQMERGETMYCSAKPDEYLPCPPGYRCTPGKYMGETGTVVPSTCVKMASPKKSSKWNWVPWVVFGVVAYMIAKEKNWIKK